MKCAFNDILRGSVARHHFMMHDVLARWRPWEDLSTYSTQAFCSTQYEAYKSHGISPAGA